MEKQEIKKRVAGVTYKDAGVDIDKADQAKLLMKSTLSESSYRVMNSLGAFGSLIDMKFDNIEHPVIVMKMEEPGSKQLLAAQHGRLPEIGFDLVHHLINDTIMMGAAPVAIQDTIVCGELEKDIVVSLVASMHKAARAQGCDLVGGETSEQPRVIPAGSYILSAACIGIVEKSKIIDGSSVKEGDVVLAVSSNGVHTNGYTLIRSLLENNPSLAEKNVGDETFIEAVLRPHLCYNQPLQHIFNDDKLAVNGLAHITGGGIVDNTARVIPDGLTANIDLSKVYVLDIFNAIHEESKSKHDDMLRTFNMGVGLVVILPSEHVKEVSDIFASYGMRSYLIGEVSRGDKRVSCVNELSLICN
ncbi:MAG: phosphoribosylformylglycinamidine cyclo-ligase [Bdellovibrionota bacterium]